MAGFGGGGKGMRTSTPKGRPQKQLSEKRLTNVVGEKAFKAQLEHAKRNPIIPAAEKIGTRPRAVASTNFTLGPKLGRF